MVAALNLSPGDCKGITILRMNALHPERRLFLEIAFAKTQQPADRIIEGTATTIGAPKRRSERQATENRTGLCELEFGLKMVCHFDAYDPPCARILRCTPALDQTFSHPGEKLGRRSTRCVLISRSGRQISRTDLFRIQPESLRIHIAIVADGHIEQPDARLFADNSVRLAHDKLTAVLALVIHGRKGEQVMCHKIARVHRAKVLPSSVLLLPNWKQGN